MATLTIVQTGITRSTTDISSYSIGLTVTGSTGMAKEIFVKQRIKKYDGTIDDIFAAVCTPTQLEDLSVKDPTSDTSFFRDSSITLVHTNPDYLLDIVTEIISEAQNLADSVEALNVLPVQQIYNIQSGQTEVIGQTVDEISTTGSKAIVFETPQANDNSIIFYTNSQITISQLVPVLVGSGSMSVTWDLKYGAIPQTGGAEVITGGHTSQNTETITSFNNSTVPAGSFVWISLTAVQGQVDEFSMTIIYN